MSTTKKRYDASFKAKVAMEAFKGDSTLSELSARYGVHSTVIAKWKKELLSRAKEIFATPEDKASKPSPSASPEAVKELHAKIGQLTIENDPRLREDKLFILKASSLDRMTRLSMVENRSDLPVFRQCELLSLPRSSYYYAPKGESEANLSLMRAMDEQFLKTPFYGVRRMAFVMRQAGFAANDKRVRRLMRLMGLEAVGPKPRTSVANIEHKRYPYLLRDTEILRPNQAWASDITYIPMRKGFLYLVAIMDWFSRKVLSWRLSNTLEADFCVDSLAEALQKYGPPEIVNTDQGCQFTAAAWIGEVEGAGAKVSMDGKGRCIDNVFVERLWRSLKYECVYLHDWETGGEARKGLAEWIDFYNHERPHSALAYDTPARIHASEIIVPESFKLIA
jgi:putative transposase